MLRTGIYSDLDNLFSIYMDERVVRFLNFEIMSKDAFLNIVNELIDTGQLFVYEQSPDISAACIVMRQKRCSQHVASLGMFATNPKFHGQGIGAQFMRTLFKKLKGENIKRVDLCVGADNPVAQKFYKKLGFQQEGVLKNYYKRPYEDHFIDEYLMALML